MADNLPTRLFPGRKTQFDESALEAVDDHLAPDESIEYRFHGSDSLTCEGDDGTETIPVAADGQSLAVVTDRKLLFAVETPGGESIVEVPYTDLKDISVSDSFLGTTLTVDVWAQGTYTFSPADSDSLERAVAFVDRVSACWQRVVAALQDVEGQTETIRDHLEAGRLDAAEDVSEEASRKLDRAESKVDSVGFGATDALEGRIESTARAFDRARMEGRLARVETLLREARHQTDSQAYTGAYESYQRARAHLEAALVIDIEWDFGRAAEIRTQLEDLETRRQNLYVRPMALAHQALERARGTEKIDVEVQALRDAFEHYRDALTAGWGLDTEFSQDPDLRERIGTVLGDLIDARRRFARELTADGDKYRAAGEEGTARDRYAMARNQLDAAATLARQFRAGDCDAIDEQRRIVTRRLVAAVV